MGSRLCAGPGARSARALGAGGSRPAAIERASSSRAIRTKPDYRALQPFGQVPILEENGHVLFESGAIVLYIGERSETLLPKDPGARARATQWLIAALNSIEPFVMKVAAIDLFYANEEWAKLRRPGAVEFAQQAPVRALPSRSATSPISMVTASRPGILMMATVLRILKHTDIVTGRQAPCRLRRTLHRAACFQTCARCADR